MPPHNPRWLRSAALLALVRPPLAVVPSETALTDYLPCPQFIAMLYVIAGIILFVVLEQESSFVSFWSVEFSLSLRERRRFRPVTGSPRSSSLQNISSTTREDCEERYNRAWLILLAVGCVASTFPPALWLPLAARLTPFSTCRFVLFSHIALGFPVYRYTSTCGSSSGPTAIDLLNLELARRRTGLRRAARGGLPPRARELGSSTRWRGARTVPAPLAVSASVAVRERLAGCTARRRDGRSSRGGEASRTADGQT